MLYELCDPCPPPPPPPPPPPSPQEPHSYHDGPVHLQHRSVSMTISMVAPQMLERGCEEGLVRTGGEHKSDFSTKKVQ